MAKKEIIDQKIYYNNIKELNIAHYSGEVSYYSKALLRGVEKKILDKLKQGANLLDLGCGSGRFSIGAAQMGFSVTGVDISHKPLRLRNKEQNILELQILVFYPRI